jgi:hypothetical protein
MPRQERYFTVKFRQEYASFIRERLGGMGKVLEEANRNEYGVIVYKSSLEPLVISRLFGDEIANERRGVQVNYLNGVKGKAIELGKESL